MWLSTASMPATSITSMWTLRGNKLELLSTRTQTHTHTHLFNGPLSRTTRVSRYQKGTTNLDFTEARDSEWQWHQLGHMHVCTSLQTDSHASTPTLSVLQAGCPSCHPINSIKVLKAKKHWWLSTKTSYWNYNRFTAITQDNLHQPIHLVKNYNSVGTKFYCLHALADTDETFGLSLNVQTQSASYWHQSTHRPVPTSIHQGRLGSRIRTEIGSNSSTLINGKTYWFEFVEGDIEASREVESSQRWHQIHNHVIVDHVVRVLLKSVQIVRRQEQVQLGLRQLCWHMHNNPLYWLTDSDKVNLEWSFPKRQKFSNFSYRSCRNRG